MARASPIITASNAGELSPALDGRVDLSKYPLGCKRLENFLSLVQGPAVRRGGTRFAAEVKTSADDHPWLLRFEFSATQCFHIEFGDRYCRFFTNHGQLVVSGVAAWSGATNYVLGDLVVSGGINYYCILAHINHVPPNATYWYPLTGAIYEIPSPYPLADLTNDDGTFALQIEQSGDVLYIANMFGTYEPRKLTRLGQTNWTFSTYQPNQGPLLEQNTGTTTIIASAATGAITLTASAALFAATDVGRLVRLDVQDLDTKPWQTGIAYLINDLVRSDGKTYKALGAATSGTSPPVHEQGNAYDGKAGVQWAYQNAGYGIARITAFTDTTHVSATVVTDAINGLNLLPAEVTGVATKRWQLGAWSATTGYPSAVGFFLGRLFWAASISRVPRLWGSVPDDFENMAADFFNEVRADNAIARIVASREVNDILWLAGAEKLVIGTGGGEFVAGPISSSSAMGPANFEIVSQGAHRVRSVRPLVVGTSLAYVQRAGRKVLSLDYNLSTDRYASTDRTVLADRVTRPGVIGMVLQGEPTPIVWAWLAGGALRAFTYSQEQDVQGWARQPIGGNGAVEAASAGPSPEGDRDEVWLIVRRTINGVTKRYVEFMERPWEGDDEDGTPGDDQEDAFYVDCGLTYDGVPATTLSGLSHLEGQTVQIFADGARQPDKTVTAGQITLTRAASVVQVGLQYISRMVPMRLEAGSQTGSAQGKIKRIDELVIRFLESLGGQAGQYGKALDDLSYRLPATPMGQPSPFFTGDHRMQYPGDYELEGLIEIVQDAPLPMTIVALLPQVRTYDK